MTDVSSRDGANDGGPDKPARPVELPFNITTRGLPDLARPGQLLHPDWTYHFHAKAFSSGPERTKVLLAMPERTEESGGHGSSVAIRPEQQEWLRAWLDPRKIGLHGSTLATVPQALLDELV